MKSPAISDADNQPAKSPAEAETGRGFTLIEFLLTVAVFLLLVGLLTPLAGRFFTQSQKEALGRELLFDLRLVRDRALAGIGGSAHGFYVDQAPDGRWRYTLYQGNDFLSRDPAADRVVILPAVISLPAAWLDEEINFALGTGRPTVSFGDPGGLTGNQTLTLSHQAEGDFIINVNPYSAVFRAD